MTKDAMSTQSFEITRVRFDSTRTFDEVRSSLLSHMGAVNAADAFTNVYRAQTAADFESSLEPFVGASGFMLFFEVDHSRWLPLYGISRRAVRLIFGNPLIAITMIRHDITASLFAPVELLLFDNEHADGSTIVYDLPSSLMQARSNPELLKTARALDSKLESLVREAMGTAAD
jgi:uncharacterized protein (DUF302 family)